MTPYDTSRSLTRRVPIYDSSSVVEYHSPVNTTKLLISRSVYEIDKFHQLEYVQETIIALVAWIPDARALLQDWNLPEVFTAQNKRSKVLT